MKLRWYIGGTALAIAVVASPASAQDRLVHQEVDRSTNAVVKVFRTKTGGRIEVATPGLTLNKSVAGDRVVTRVEGRGDELTITMDPKTLTVAGRMGRLSTSRTNRSDIERARVIVAGSAAGRAAADLIGRLALRPATPIQPMLITTRAFLLAAAGDKSAGADLARWARAASTAARPAPTALRVNLDLQEFQKSESKTMTPTECWEAYTKEAIAAYMEYEDCMNNQEWWDLLGQAGCATIYDMRAVGAFSWWLKCVALN